MAAVAVAHTASNLAGQAAAAGNEAITRLHEVQQKLDAVSTDTSAVRSHQAEVHLATQGTQQATERIETHIAKLKPPKRPRATAKRGRRKPANAATESKPPAA